MGKIFLVLIDAHSKWMEVQPVCSATSSNTISDLRTIFATFGLPEILVSDNGSVFTSEEFRVFIKRNGIRHLTPAPYHPATNGLAEQAVQIFKRALKKADLMISRFNWQDFFIITSLLLRHPQVPLLQLLMGRPLRTHLELLKPDLAGKVRRSQTSQTLARDGRSKQRFFSPSETVYIRKSDKESQWIPVLLNPS